MISNNKKRIFSILLFVSVFSLYSFKAMGEMSEFDRLSIEKADIINEKSAKYLEGVTKIDYNLTYTGFVLKKFTENKNIYFTGGTTLVIERKTQPQTKSGTTTNTERRTLDGEFLYVNNIKIIKQGGKYYYKQQQYPNTLNSSLSENDLYKTYNLVFLTGFTKMKLVGNEYEYFEKNLILDNTYTMNLFFYKNLAIVMSFENEYEKRKRTEIYNEYLKKIDQIRKENKGDIFMTNKLTSILNQAYDIRISLLR